MSNPEPKYDSQSFNIVTEPSADGDQQLVKASHVSLPQKESAHKSSSIQRVHEKESSIIYESFPTMESGIDGNAEAGLLSVHVQQN